MLYKKKEENNFFQQFASKTVITQWDTHAPGTSNGMEKMNNKPNI